MFYLTIITLLFLDKAAWTADKIGLADELGRWPKTQNIMGLKKYIFFVFVLYFTWTQVSIASHYKFYK